MALLIVIVGGATAFAYFTFFKPVSAPIGGANAPAAASLAGPEATAQAPSAMPAGGTVAVAPHSPANTSPPPVGVTSVPRTSGPPAATGANAQPALPPPPVAPIDHSLQIATDLVRKGERAYANGDYAAAIRHAHSALDVYAGHAGAQRLLRRAEAAQQKLATERQQARQAQQAQQQAAAAALAKQRAALLDAQRPPAPTPDQLYDQRAHSECARGFFGKMCRHNVRQQVCAGVSLTAPGADVCKALKD